MTQDISQQTWMIGDTVYPRPSPFGNFQLTGQGNNNPTQTQSGTTLADDIKNMGTSGFAGAGEATGNAIASTFGGLGNIGYALQNYFVRAVIIILGLIFITGGVHMFGQQSIAPMLRK